MQNSFNLTVSLLALYQTLITEEERNGDEKAQPKNHNHITTESVQTLFHIGLKANPKHSRIFLPEMNKEQTESLV